MNTEGSSPKPVQQVDTNRSPEPLMALTLDDDKIDRLRLIRTCEKAGLVVTFHQAASIAEMRELLDEIEFDVIFMDHNLGIDTGLDALKVVRGHENQVNALPIMLTSLASHRLAVEAMRQGCADFIVKEELTVNGLTKSITSSIERRMLQAAISDARNFQDKVAGLLSRFMHSSGPEMRAIIASMLRGLRSAKASGELDAIQDSDLRVDITKVERGCKDLIVFLDDMVTLIDRVETEAVRPQDRVRIALN